MKQNITQNKQNTSNNIKEAIKNKEVSPYHINWITNQTDNHLEKHQQIQYLRPQPSNKLNKQSAYNFLPHRNIILHQQTVDKENQKHQRKNSHMISGNSTQKSCEKREKLSVVSKRLSLRKIADFLLLPSDKNGQIFESFPDKPLKQSKQNSQTNCREFDLAKQNNFMPEKKQKVRISLRRQPKNKI